MSGLPEDPMAHLRPREIGDLPIPDTLHMLTCALFFEWKHHSSCTETPPFTLKKQDHKNNRIVYRSMYQMYMQCNTEYEAAMLILGSWPHWEKLCKCKWFHEEVETWRNEMTLRDNALARDKLVELTKKGNVTAARTILTETKKKPNRVGRPGTDARGRSATGEDLDALLGHAENTKD
jgi:hypothetical protein